MVTVQPVTTDRYGRTVAHILVDGNSVSHEMVRTGNAFAYKKYMKDKSLLELEADARDSKRGLWGLPESDRLEPWKWRKNK